MTALLGKITWSEALKYALKIAAYLARRAQDRKAEEAILNVLEGSFRERVDRAADARNQPDSVQPDDPYRRD